MLQGATGTASANRFDDRYGVEFAGTCDHEGVFGEITVAKAGAPADPRGWAENLFNFVFEAGL
jgi:hypothetical protein